MSSAMLATVAVRRAAPLIATPLYLSEDISGLADGAGFLNGLSEDERYRVLGSGRRLAFATGDNIFIQGSAHDGIFVIMEGRVRVFYTGPSGREVTLAYWTAGNFIGGPSIHSGGTHQWSGAAIEPVEVVALSRKVLRTLMIAIPAFSICLIDGLEAKGRCYTAVAQMLGTRSVIERLAQLLLNLCGLYGRQEGSVIAIDRMISHDEIAALLGATRQWVTMMMKRFKNDGIIDLRPGRLLLRRKDALEAIVRGDTRAEYPGG